jgi:hypothetical protein
MLVGLVLSCGIAEADVDTGDVSEEKMVKPKESNRPYEIELNADSIGKAKIDKSGYHGEHVRYQQAEAEIGAIVYYNPDCKEGARVGVSYSTVRLDWNENPYFHQTRFNQATLSLGLFTQRLSNWLWQAHFGINYDTRHRNFNHYTNFDILLWGRYEYTPDLGIHTGFLAYTGMHIDKIYPVIGIDWKINDRWQLNLIYPINVALIYTINDCWSVAIAGRSFLTRRRAGKDERKPESLFEYQNIGAEFAVRYQYNSWLSANIHGGETFAGRLKISNRHHRHQKSFDLGSAPYVGGEIDIKF